MTEIADEDLAFFKTACQRARRVLITHLLGASIDDLAARVTLAVAVEIGRQMRDPGPEAAAVLARHADKEQHVD